MRRVTGWLFAFVLLAGPHGARAQESPAPSVPVAAGLRPPVELGLGCNVAAVASEGFGAVPLGEARVGVRLTPRLSVEGLADVWPGSLGDGIGGIYRTQVVWRPAAKRTGVLFGLGVAGAFDWNHWPEYQWTDSYGQVHVEPGGRSFDMSVPVVPTASVGFERSLGRRLAIRAEVTAAFIPDDELFVVLMPAVSLSVPVGRRGLGQVRNPTSR